MMSKIAFLGLGHMGAPMAGNLVAAGHSVRGFDPAPAAADAARALDVPVVPTMFEAVSSADVVITMLPAGSHVLAAYQEGLLEVATPGTLFIDSSTISVDDARAAHALALAGGHRQIDAPVSGGTVGAQGGTLAFMVGASQEDFDAAHPVLQVMGRRIVHCGEPGLGQAAKLCNNMILAINMIAVSEAFVLAEALGLSSRALFDVSSNASGQCWALTANCPVPGLVDTSPANSDYRPGFSGALMAKDLGLAQRAIEITGVHAELGSLANVIYRRFANGEGALRDFSGIIADIRAASGVAS